MNLNGIKISPEWPKVGDKIVYKGTHHFWFTDIVANAEKELVLQKEYTISKIDIYSSWVGVWLEEKPDTQFALSFFKYETGTS